MGREEKEKKEKGGYGERLREITAVLKKHAITRGVSPEKLRLILEDLGPTYIKLGQIMSLRSDILPKRYCDELMKLCSEVPPMPFSQVIEVLEESMGCPWQAELHKAVRLMPPVSIKGMVDLNMVLSELWTVTQEEMNFLTEAANMAEFAKKNKDVAFVKVPILYREYISPHILVMEYIDGFAVNDKAALLANGYDLNEVGTKYVDNFIKQVMEDGFFHADPHPGNVRIQDGKIVWIDMGMMGRLTEHDRQLIAEAIEGVAMNNIGKIQDAVLALGEFKGKPDSSKLYEDIRGLMEKYGTADMGNIDVAEVMVDLMEVMKENKIMMPHGLTMLARGLTHVEGVLAEICPDINMTQIAAARLKEQLFSNGNWKREIKKEGKNLAWSLKRAVDIPSLAADFLQGCMKGQTKINLDLHASDDLAWLLRRLVRNIVMGLWVMALLISSSIICTTDMKPKLWGIPALGAFGYVFAFIIVLYVFIKHFFSGKK